MAWFRATQASITNGQSVVTINSGEDIANVSPNDALIIGSFAPVEIKRAYLGGGGEKYIELVQPWTDSTQATVAARVIPTAGDFADATQSLKDATVVTSDNFTPLQDWYSQMGSVTFTESDGVTQHTVRTAQQMDADASALYLLKSDAYKHSEKSISSSSAPGDLNNINIGGQYFGYNWGANAPSNSLATVSVEKYSPDWFIQNFSIVSAIPNEYTRTYHSGNAWGEWYKKWHDGNTGVIDFNYSISVTGSPRISFSPNDSMSTIETTISSYRGLIHFLNPNGLVGSIGTNGSTTVYNTSSDPRLKSDFTVFNATKAWQKFDDMLASAGTFHFLSEPTKEVWGFNAHAVIDAGLDIGSEGEGPRTKKLGDIYKTTPAVFETQQQPVFDADGNPTLDNNGKAITEAVEVEVTPAIEHKVTPAGVDQSKAVPYLIAVIDDLRKRDEAKSLLIEALSKRLDDAGL